MYQDAIIEMITWPVLIIISYAVIRFVLKKYESKMESQQDSE